MGLNPGYKYSEVGVIPCDWKLCQVGQMGDVVTGKALAAFAAGLQRPYLRTKNVFDGQIVIDDVLTMPMTDAQFAHFMLKYGDVLLNEGQSLELVGRCSIYRDEYPVSCAIQNQLLRFRANESTSSIFASHLFRYCQQTGVFARIALQTTSIAHLGGTRFERLVLAWPPSKAEQRAIAEALSEMDQLIGSIAKLIAKKRAIKQATMQQLLTAKTRLPGFSEDWKTKFLREISESDSGGTPSTKNPKYFGGGIPWASIADMTNVDKMLFRTRKTLSKAGLLISPATIWPSKTILYAMYASIGECCIAGMDLCSSQAILGVRPNSECHGEYLFYQLQLQKRRVKAMAQHGTQPNLNAEIVRGFRIPFPSLDEQIAIATALSDIDTEIEALERRLTKTKHIKQGMMQQLLTGRIRLVEQQVAESKAEVVEETKGTKPHSWAFNEAVVISMLTKNFGSEQYPLGRKRYTKYSYLLHRHAEKKAEGYLKKAAGPYNPSTKYGGPEKIAVENGYISKQKSGKFQGFVAACSIDKAEEYFEKWYGSDAMQWLEQFRYKKNDELEVLATVDMAAEDLRTSGKAVDVESVKKVIANHPEWKAKLDRSAFSDTNISEAIKAVSELFGGEVHA